MPPTLFLDFDGVLHPTHAREDEWFCRMGILEEALADRDVGIVISSSWRFHHALASLVRHFSSPLRQQIVGVIGDAFIGAHARWNEIRIYVATHGIRNWRALDDSGFEFPALCAELILCDGAKGIDAPQVERIANLVRQKG